MQSNKASQVFVNEDTVECDVRFGAKRKVRTKKVLTRKFLLLESPESLPNFILEKTYCAVNSTVPNALHLCTAARTQDQTGPTLLKKGWLLPGGVVYCELKSHIVISRNRKIYIIHGNKNNFPFF